MSTERTKNKLLPEVSAGEWLDFMEKQELKKLKTKLKDPVKKLPPPEVFVNLKERIMAEVNNISPTKKTKYPSKYLRTKSSSKPSTKTKVLNLKSS